MAWSLLAAKVACVRIPQWASGAMQKFPSRGCFASSTWTPRLRPARDLRRPRFDPIVVEVVMPVKRRASKQRFSNAALLEAWSMPFQCGCDFFGDLKPLGIDARSILEADEDVMAAAREAWGRLGEAFMVEWQPIKGVREKPWAFEQFGEPN
jgi:hypothetical protein